MHVARAVLLIESDGRGVGGVHPVQTQEGFRGWNDDELPSSLNLYMSSFSSYSRSPHKCDLSG